MDENKQIELEIKLTYLEETVSQLNRTIHTQQTRIDRYEKQLERLLGRIKALEEISGTDQIPDVRPPHY